VFTAWVWLVCDLWELGDTDGFRAGIARLEEIHAALRMPETAWVSAVSKGCLALFEGRLDDARTLMDEALAEGQRAQSETALQFYGVQLFALRRFEGGVEDLEPMFVAMVDEYPLIPAWRCGLVYLYTEMGALEKAREQFDILAETDFELPFDANWAVGMAILGLAAARLGDVDGSRILYERIAPQADAVITIGMPAEVIGPLHMPLALLAATAGDWEAFERHHSTGEDWFVATGGRPWLAMTKFYAGRALLGAGRDTERARAMLEEAEATSKELGLSRLEGQVAELLRST
jgi:tetratricopeptide (TPR) repeat protein